MSYGLSAHRGRELGPAGGLAPRGIVEAAILATRPILYAPLQDAGQPSIDLVRSVQGVFANGGPGTFSMPPVVAGPFPGVRALDFNRNANFRFDARTISPPTGYHPGDVLTIAGWVFRTGTGTSGEVLLDEGPSSGNGAIIWWNGSNRLALRKAGVGDIIALNFATRAQWYYVVATKDGPRGAAIWLNGRKAPTGAFVDRTIATTAANEVVVGGTNSNFPAASLAHWAIWNRVLRPEEHRWIWRSAFARQPIAPAMR